MDEIAAALDYNVSTVKKYLQKAGVAIRPRGSKKSHLLAHDLSIFRRYEKGEPIHRIAASHGVAKGTLTKVLRQQGAHIKDRSECQVKYQCKRDFFANISTEAQAYWLGFLTADGTIGSQNIISLNLSLRDGDHVRWFASTLETDYPVKDRPDLDPPETHFSFRSTQMAEDLAKYGIIQNKGDTIWWPQLPENVMPHYLRGVVDGDGGFVSTRGQISVSLALNETYLLDCQRYLIQKFGFSATKISRVGPKKGIYVLKYGGNAQLLPFINWLYNGATIYLHRKRQKVIDHYHALPAYKGCLEFEYWHDLCRYTIERRS